MSYNHPMTLTPEQVEHIANLARLGLTDEEKARFQQQLSAILDHFQELQAVDTSQVSANARLGLINSILRDDESRSGQTLEKTLQNAPESAKRQFKIPPVFE